MRNEDLILLNMIEDFGFKKLEALLNTFQNIPNILKARESDLVAADGVGKSLAEKIAGLDRKRLSRELDFMEKRGVKAIGIFDDDYPESLKNIYSPPILLYVRGRIRPEDADAIAIVGSRRTSYYGISTCERLAEQLASRGIAVISGLARGIDTTAHKGALKSGRTIAVLGSGLNYIYPPENRRLAEEISKKGAVISEFPMATPPNSRNFPRRNRIISGLSLGVVVVEASEKSGSLITANFALEENRELFAVPGEISSRISAGTNNLIKQGAKLVENADDIMVEVENSLKFANVERRVGDSFGTTADRRLTDEEKGIKRFLSYKPIYIDELAKKSDVNVSKMSSLLLSLELKNIIKELPGKNFILR